jgi:colanic acid biosynthesis glycosyl transferase WcaI
MTDPPFIADLGLAVARLYRAPLVVVSQDVFPEVAVELRRLENGPTIWLLRKLVDFYLRRADRVVAIGETMSARLQEKGARPERIRVIPNWVDTESLQPRPRENEWAHEHGLDGRFVVMHSGNIGHAQNLDALISAGTFLRDLDRLAIVLIGGGARRAELGELAERLQVDAVSFLPYQPRELLSQSLSAANLHVVGLAQGLSGFVVPSRLYGILSVGRPVIVAADADSETARVVDSVGCGVVVPPGDPTALARVIRSAYAGELPLEEMGARGRAYVVEEGDRRVAVDRYRSLLRELVTVR